ncbi:MAG: hypothetical protein WBQ75_16465 [Acetobacteraceae bacterium]
MVRRRLRRKLRISMRGWPTYSLLYALMACAIAVGMGSLNVPAEYALALHARTADGAVIRPSCDQHATVIYRFHLNGQDYVGQDQTQDDNCGRVRPDDHVVVWYLPDHPETSMLRVPGGALANELISIALAATLVPTVIVLPIASRLRRRARRTVKPPPGDD